MSRVSMLLRNTDGLTCCSRTCAKKWLLAFGTACLFCAVKYTACSEVRRFPLRGQVIDAQHRVPLESTVVSIVINAFDDRENRDSVSTRTVRSDAGGWFDFQGVPEGKQKLRIVKADYHPFEQVIDVDSSTAELQVVLQKVAFQLEGITVYGSSRGLPQLDATTGFALDEVALQKRLGMTLASTLTNELGVSERTLGRAVARPVIRGLGGNRLLILENGVRTGDKSASSADHAVAFDPTSAKNVEITRGPASLLYGSSTLGGVVNVRSNSISAVLPKHPSMDLSFQSETVNSGVMANTRVAVPVGDFAGVMEWNRRLAKDTRTPLGILENTAVSNINFSTGASIIQEWGHLGLSGGSYRSHYGIPGSPEGHITGVNIVLDRQRYEGQLEYGFSRAWLDKIKFQGAYTRYQHQELESNGSIGVEFGVLTYSVSAMAHVFDNAIMGVWWQYRDHATGGFYWTPHTREFALAGFYLNQRNFDRFTLQGAIRYDISRTAPFYPGTVIRAGAVEQRDFNGVSGAVSGIYRWNDRISAGGTLMKTFRAPGIEELFSDGPHLAIYSYEIGNAALPAENGYGSELFGRYSSDRVKFKLALFHNQIENYLIPTNTGEKDWGSGAAGWLWIYQYMGQDVVMDGVEIEFQSEVLPRFHVQFGVSYLNGRITSGAQARKPLERIPPLNGKFALRYIRVPFEVHLTTRFSASQTRLGEFEEPTDGYLVYDAGCYFNLPWWKLENIVVLEVENLLDTAYREHLSRIKSIMPEPGRNVKFLYKLNF